MGGTGSGVKVPDPNWKPAAGTKPWERQPAETHASWTAFKSYRDFGGVRTMAKAAKTLGKKPTYINKMQEWSTQHHWQIRVVAWDRYQDEVSQQTVQEVRREAVKEMMERHLKISNHIQRLATVEVLRWVHKVGANEANPDLKRRPTLTPQQIHTLIDYAVKLERLNRNEPNEIHETRTTELTTEEVEERIAHLLRSRDEEDG